MQARTTRRRFMAILGGIAAGLGIGFPAVAQVTPAVIAPPAPAELPLIPMTPLMAELQRNNVRDILVERAMGGKATR